VKVSLVPRFDHVNLIVEDTGVGISPEHLPHIFDRFYRVPSADPEKGLGLGLSFVAWIAKAHGGAVTAESKLQEGTRFTVLLPVGRWSGAPPNNAPAETQTPVVPERVH
jgi:signal transduction histidine kinase